MLLLACAPVLIWLTQRMPECDMALVHDDSLAQIGDICTGNLVSTHFPSIQSFHLSLGTRIRRTTRYGDKFDPKLPTRSSSDSLR